VQQFREEEIEPTTRSHRIESDEPASNSTRIARLEGKVDLLATDVRAVLTNVQTTSKKLVVARTLGAAAAGMIAALAPAHAEKIAPLIDSLLGMFV
jgi:hypothetical protein